MFDYGLASDGRRGFNYLHCSRCYMQIGEVYKDIQFRTGEAHFCVTSERARYSTSLHIAIPIVLIPSTSLELGTSTAVNSRHHPPADIHVTSEIRPLIISGSLPGLATKSSIASCLPHHSRRSLKALLGPLD